MCLEYSGAIAKYLFHFHPENHQFFAHELSQSNVALLSYSSISRKSSSTPTPHIYYAGTFQWQSSCSFSGQNIFMQISNNVCMPLCLCATQLFEKSSKSFQLKYTMYVIWYEWILFIHTFERRRFVRSLSQKLSLYVLRMQKKHLQNGDKFRANVCSTRRRSGNIVFCWCCDNGTK